MWTIIKFDKKKINFLKKDFSKYLGDDVILYRPKLLIQKYIKNKLIGKEFELLGDYIFCFNKKFKNPDTIKNLKFCRGLKYFLNGFINSQDEIENFISKCKKSENKEGYISSNLINLSLEKKDKVITGPFSEKIFQIIKFQKNKIDIFLGNIRTSINSDNYLFRLV